MQISVFVNSIVKNGVSGVTVEASNGGPDGPPFIRFTWPESQAKDIHIGKRYTIEINES